MSIEKADIIVIGAGVVGLAVALELIQKSTSVIILEANENIGMETSSHNSEVIHAGIYYHEEMLKTRLCVEGNPLLYEFCSRYQVPSSKCGKLIVANSGRDREIIETRYEQGKKNGVPGLREITEREIMDLEPHISGTMGIYSETSGILDTRSLLDRLAELFRERGGRLALNSRVCSIEKDAGGYSLETAGPDGVRGAYRSESVVNSAGLGASDVAARAGFDTKRYGYHLHFCKGEYFAISDGHRGKLKHLVYPAPDPNHLGAHAVLCLDGRLKIGPGSTYVDSVDYTVDPGHVDIFWEKAVRFLPFLRKEDLTPDFAGVRPKLNGPDELLGDFTIREEHSAGFPGFVNLIGMESPALTACLSIARMVKGLL